MPEDVDAFIERWSRAAASERANAQQFVIELADLLGVPRPGNDHDAGYSFEFPLKIPRADGTFTQGFIDLYRRRSFVLEAKQFQSEPEPPTPLQVVAEEAGVYTAKKKSGPVRGSDAWDDADAKLPARCACFTDPVPACCLLPGRLPRACPDTKKALASRHEDLVGDRGAVVGERLERQVRCGLCLE